MSTLKAASALFVSVCIYAAPMAATAQSSEFTDPAALDQAIASFTGAPIGAAGGARAPVDRRLRLAQCNSSVAITPYGNRADSLQVSCLDPGSWRIFVPLAKGPQAQAAQTLVSKGDQVSIAIEGRGFSVVQSGRALESGAAGDWIRVAPPGKGETIRARVERPGRVMIPLG